MTGAEREPGTGGQNDSTQSRVPRGRDEWPTIIATDRSEKDRGRNISTG